MTTFLEFIGSSALIQFISTFGLAAVLVIYFVFFRDHRLEKAAEDRYKEILKKYTENTEYWQTKYDSLDQRYSELSQNYESLKVFLNYKSLEESYENVHKINQQLMKDYGELQQRAALSDDQIKKVCYVALDRDLYKLHKKVCEQIDSNQTDVDNAIKETIMDTNDTWAEFKTPFLRAPTITHLYGVYANGGDSLKQEIKGILDSEDMEHDMKKTKVWDQLYSIVLGMRSEFADNLQKHRSGEEIVPYQEAVPVSPGQTIET